MFNIIDFPDYIQPINERQSTIKFSWRFMRLLNHRINCMPNGWVLWPEESFVNEIEKIYLLKGKKAAHVAIAQLRNLKYRWIRKITLHSLPRLHMVIEELTQKRYDID